MIFHLGHDHFITAYYLISIFSHYPTFSNQHWCSQFDNCKSELEINKGSMHFCTECDFKTPSTSHLRYHKQSLHMGIRYSCDQCDHQAITKAQQLIHKESIHMAVKNPCSVCEYQAPTKDLLQIHGFVHMERKFPCNQCSFIAKWKKKNLAITNSWFMKEGKFSAHNVRPGNNGVS